MNDFNNDKLPDWLDDQKRKNPYKVPEGYFESFYSNLPLDRTKDQKGSKVILFGFWKYAVAAAVVGIIAISAFQFQKASFNQQPMASITSIDWDDLDDAWDDFQTQEILSLFTDEEIESIEIGLFDTSEEFLEDFMEGEMYDEDLELLLNEENI